MTSTRYPSPPGSEFIGPSGGGLGHEILSLGFKQCTIPRDFRETRAARLGQHHRPPFDGVLGEVVKFVPVDKQSRAVTQSLAKGQAGSGTPTPA